ncbi:putative uncharacterized protein DDB_G0282133 isoform X2 [Panonychus citri]|uniref:putative uncharacterized protein DDB_G0282133 isoform X2 n=1 Tax=Panonychus citri TaxID=50023 RepID=UPI00230818E0|nr:putative uncharacterized protein DDB_G0282133 isoform X2 [Panonychus citri]
MQGQSVKTYENPCNLIIGNYSNHLKTSTQSTNYHHYYYPTCHPLETPSTTINPVTINIIENNNSKIDPDSLLPCLHLSSIMTGSNKISIESLTNNSSGHLKNSTTTTTTIGNNLINNNNNLTNNNNNINSNMNHIHNNQTNINHNCINTINSSVNNSINNVNGTLNNHSNYTTTNKLMMKLLPWCKLKRKQFVFRDSLSCDDISSVMFRRSSVQPISGLFNDKNYQLTTITSSSSSPSTSTMTTSTSVTPSSSSITSSSHSTTSSSSMTMARLFTGKRNSNNNKSNGNLNSILSYTMTNRKRNCHNNSITNGHSGSSISSYPMVSFVNKGEGLVTVDSTFDRILMSNENELYSLGSAINNPHHHSHHPSSTSSSVSSSFNSFSNGSSSLSSSKSMGNLGANYGPSCSRINSSTYSTSDCDLPSVYGSMGANELPPWFYGPICRDNAIDILARQPIGSFLVRESISKPGCYALSVRVPKRFQVTGVAHYLIIRSSQGTFKIKNQIFIP